ncbi:MAG: CCA tRNA nucleotidyltransferase, partial [Roseovarius sp.]|nr:CCA tRNA nucleotidyltransferase [Roseovarius sp.]
AQRIQEDYLRILRFFRFHAWYGDPKGGLDAEGLAACAMHTDGLAGLSRERVSAEILKLLGAADPAPSVAAMRSVGVLMAVLPGAEDRALGPLVHLESVTDTPPDAIRRLAVLGGQDVTAGLRLSKAQARRLAHLREGALGTMGAAELGYRYGMVEGLDILVLRAAFLEQPLAAGYGDDLAQGSAARFPVKAADLMPSYRGAALGAQLAKLEKRWIASGFRLGRDDLV